VRQDGQTLSFVVNRVNVYELKNWLRKLTSVRRQAAENEPHAVDHLSDVKAEVQLTWGKTA
jgi:general secretion pathway protein M